MAKKTAKKTARKNKAGKRGAPSALNYTFFPKEAIEKARLTSTVVQVDGDLVSLSFAGESRSSIVSLNKIGYEPKLLGRAKYSLKDQRFISFELVAVGMGWGAATNVTTRLPL